MDYCYLLVIQQQVQVSSGLTIGFSFMFRVKGEEMLILPGTISGIVILIIGISSFSYFRRHHYNCFYSVNAFLF